MSKICPIRLLTGGALAALLLATHGAAFDNFWLPLGPTPADWNDDGNWSEGGVPSIGFQEDAIINNGGYAFLQDAAEFDAGGVVLGRAAGESGTLEIRSNGKLNVVSGVNNTGAVIVGQGGGTGTLNMLGNAELTAVTLSSSGAASSINMAGTSQITTSGSMNLGAVTDITGQSASLDAGENLVLGGSSVVRIDINGAAAPLMKAAGNAALAGTLEIDFGVVPPTPGSSWNLLDAGSISGGFSQVNVTGAPIEEYQRLRFREVESGSSMNGTFGQLVLDQLLVLEIDRDSGAMTIRNPSGTSSASLEGYQVTSGGLSVFNLANYVSLESQSKSGWIEANPQTTQLAELDTNAATVVPAGGSGDLSLGNPWNPQYTEFGQNIEDQIEFKYEIDGEEIAVPVLFTGVKVNDMALIVDPATGEAQIRNASNFSVDIEGYSILSPSPAGVGSLNPAGLDSLQDNPALSNWLVANPTGEAISELKTHGVETLSGGEAYNIGSIFNMGGEQDLVFQYWLPDSIDPVIGRVLYEELPPITSGLIGDYNEDGKVDAADYVVWRRTGINGQQGYNDWRSNYGATAPGAGAGGGSLAAVPEPTSMSMLAIVVMLGACGRRFKCVTG